MKTLKEIGVVPDKKILSKHSVFEQGVEIKIENLEHRGFNEAIDLISEWKVDNVIDREALAKKLAQNRGGHSGFPPAAWDYDLADVLIKYKDTWCSIKAIEENV